MDIVLANRVNVIANAMHAPVVMESESLISFEYKWLIPCAPQVIKVVCQPVPSVAARNQIEEVKG